MTRLSHPGEVKPSGQRWLASIPIHWHAGPVKRFIARIESGTSVNATDLPAADGELGVLKTSCVYTGAFDPTKNKTVVPNELDLVSCPVRPGSLIVSRMNTPDLVGAAGLVKMAAPNLYLPDRLWQISFDGIEPAFAHYWTQSNIYRACVKAVCAGTSASMQNLSQDDFRAFPFAAPARPEQALIAGFLDRETTRIDALIEKKTRFIELLREKRQAALEQLLTRGHDASVSMKDSGFAWLGRVPAHWVVTRLRFVVSRFEQGWSPDCYAYPAADGEWGVLKAGCVNGGTFDAAENKQLPAGEEPRPEIEVLAGDVLMSRASGSPDLIGSVARATATGARLMLSDKTFRITLRSDWDCDYFVALMGCTPMREQIKLSISGAEGLANNLAQASIKDFVVPGPPRHEQAAIARTVAHRTDQIDRILDRTAASIRLLKERRAALITAAVTGQIDVRAEQPASTLAPV